MFDKAGAFWGQLPHEPLPRTVKNPSDFINFVPLLWNFFFFYSKNL